MPTLIQETKPVARKCYPCDASRAWGDSGLTEHDVSNEQRLAIQGAQADGWEIRPGTQYRKCVYVDGGAIGTYRARLDMDSLAQELDLFDD